VSGRSNTDIARWLFHRVTVKDYVWTPTAGQHSPEHDLASVRRYLSRFGGPLNVAAKTALDVGCGTGQLCFELARRGAGRVVGVDIGDLLTAHESYETESSVVKESVEFLQTDGSLRELRDERFDLVFSKDSFEHLGEPERVVEAMIDVLAPGGQLVIGFGPLWKGPTGGHIDFMTKLPWAHLLFPEPVVMEERKRFRPHEDAQRFEDILGGLNKMTLARFEAIMAATGLRRRYFATNVGDNPVVRAMKVARSVPHCGSTSPRVCTPSGRRIRLPTPAWTISLGSRATRRRDRLRALP
jgi:SAM-dependent methyltransferase